MADGGAGGSGAAVKVSGPLTHARFVAEIGRLIRKASKTLSHETLRMHSGAFKPDGLVEDWVRQAFLADLEVTLKDIREPTAETVSKADV